MYGTSQPDVSYAYEMDEKYASYGGYNVSTTPEVGAMMNFERNTRVASSDDGAARWTYGSAGHVEIVKSVTYNPDGTIKSITTVGSNQSSPSHTYSGAEYYYWVNHQGGSKVHFIAPN